MNLPVGVRPNEYSDPSFPLKSKNIYVSLKSCSLSFTEKVDILYIPEHYILKHVNVDYCF